MLTAFGETGNLISISNQVSHCDNINLLLLYLVPSGVDTAYDLGVFSPIVDITVAGYQGLTLGIFYNHTNY